MPEYQIIEGVKCYAPALAFQNEDFPRESFDQLYSIESKNFWFVSRNNVIRCLVGRFMGRKEKHKKKFLEIGCGTAFVLKGLSAIPYLELSGAEVYLQGLKYARRRLPHVDFVQLDATHLPFENEFDAIGAFDVLEHIELDELVIKNVYSALKEEGCFFVSVPQYMWMWSKTDDYARHKRRYSKKELISKLRSAGFRIEYVSSFVFALFPVMILSRLFSKRATNSSADRNGDAPELNLNPVMNSIFRTITIIDEWLIRFGISLPFGGSLIAVATK
jgi:SAM-dependent methyltransferase